MAPCEYSLPGAVGMYALSLGVSNMNDTLPRPVYALLCGLNSATVGIIALAAVQLGQRAITDKLSRVLVFLGATAGMLYNALWYFPTLMIVAGFVTIAWDLKWGPKFGLSMKSWAKKILHKRPRESANNVTVEEGLGNAIWASSAGSISEPSSAFRRVGAAASSINNVHTQSHDQQNISLLEDQQDEAVIDHQVRTLPVQDKINVFSLPAAAAIVIGFFISFIVVLVLRALLKARPFGLSLFANLYLAGTVSYLPSLYQKNKNKTKSLLQHIFNPPVENSNHITPLSS